jgi:hypothetical protein
MSNQSSWHSVLFKCVCTINFYFYVPDCIQALKENKLKNVWKFAAALGQCQSEIPHQKN